MNLVDSTILSCDVMNSKLVCRTLGITDYQTTLEAMQTFTQKRDPDTPDELWLTEHHSVYTLGLNRKNVRLPQNDMPVILVDRGGKITYHGLGQVVIYVLIDLTRNKLNIRQLVDALETSIIALLEAYQIKAFAKKEAPGVYVKVGGHDKKIASLGLRLKNNCCYHGLSLNVNMDLAPFQAIDPCGYVGLQMTQTCDLGINETPTQLGQVLIEKIAYQLRK
jgi:lipoyl(octanoyl) transferase